MITFIIVVAVTILLVYLFEWEWNREKEQQEERQRQFEIENKEYVKRLKEREERHKQANHLYTWNQKYKEHNFKEYSIKGLNKINPLFFKGKFEGTAECDNTNLYDDYAIAIYDAEHILCGYLPKGNKKLFNYIKSQGGSVMAYGTISLHTADIEDDSDSDYYYGYVNVQTS